jgi:hypothetical protein
MNTGFSLATAKRSWYVPDIQVWGAEGWGDFEYLILEDVESVNSILFDKKSIGENNQLIKYADLRDFRGNLLPEKIINPKIMIKNKTEKSAFIIGSESDEGFTIARESSAQNPVPVDLYIIEMGS